MSKNDLKKYAVLYVDDEEQALKYFPKLFGGDLRCLTANGVDQARAVIERAGDTIGVVISDQRMPGENGVELLTWLRANRPHVVRILTTAYSDLDSAISSVNSGAIFRYVVKPWEHREMYGVLARAMEYHLVTRERDALLTEKMTTLQRIVVMDRRRSFVVLAAGLSQRLRNPLPALRSYLDQVPEVASQTPGDLAGLWDVAQRESQGLLRLAISVSQRVLSCEHRFVASLQLADLLAPALASARKAVGERATLTLDPSLPTCCADPDMLSRLGQILVQLVLWADPAAPAVRLAATRIALANGRPGVRISASGGPAAWTPAQHARLYQALAAGDPALHDDADLLAAYLIAHHHSGRLSVHASPPDGPGLAAVLPLDPAMEREEPVPQSWVDDVLAFQHDA
jgi:FixJ family two-component response regulator